MIATGGEAKLRMKTVYEVIPVDDTHVLVRSPDQGVRVRIVGMAAAEVVAFLEQLDGTRPIEALIAGRAERGGLTALIDGLIARDIIDANGGGAPPAAARFFAQFHDDPVSCVRRLSASRVLVCGPDPIADAVSRGLRVAGVGRVTTIDPPGWRPEARATPVDPTAGRCGDGSASSPHARPGIDRATFAAAGRGADLLVICPDAADAQVTSAVNALALEIGVPWLLVRIFGAQGFVGPLFIPDDGPCHACLLAREEANWSDREIERAYLDRIAREPGSVESYGRLPACAALVSDVAVLEATKHLSRFVMPALLGAVLRIDFAACRTELHRVMRLPRCPACSPARRRPAVDTLLYGRTA